MTSLEQQQLLGQLGQDIEKLKQEYVEMASSEELYPPKLKGNVKLEDDVKETIAGEMRNLLLKYEPLRLATRRGRYYGDEGLAQIEKDATNAIYRAYLVARGRAAAAVEASSEDGSPSGATPNQADAALLSASPNYQAASDNGQKTSNVSIAHFDAAE